MNNYPITDAQRMQYSLMQWTGKPQVLNICVSLLIHIDIEFALLQEAVQEAIARDDSARIRFTAPNENGEIFQYIAPEDVRPIPHVDLSEKTEEEANAVLQEWGHEPIFPHHDVPLCNIMTLAMPDGWNGVYIHIDHMIADSCSMILLIYDIVELYSHRVFGLEKPNDRVSYLLSLENDLKHAADAVRTARDRTFWEEQFLQGEPLYTDIRGEEPLKKAHAQAQNPQQRWMPTDDVDLCVGQHTYILEPVPSARLMEFCQEQNISMTNLLLMTLRTYLSKQNHGEKDIGIRNYVSRRISRIDRKAGGTRVHWYPCRTVMEPDMQFLDGVRIIAALQSKVYRHTDFSVPTMDAMRRTAYGAPAYSLYESVGLTYQPFPMRMKDEKLNALEYRATWHESGLAPHPIYLTVMHRPLGAGMDFYFKYQAAQYAEEDIEKMYYYMMRILFAVVDDPDFTIQEVIDQV